MCSSPCLPRSIQGISTHAKARWPPILNHPHIRGTSFANDKPSMADTSHPPQKSKTPATSLSFCRRSSQRPNASNGLIRGLAPQTPLNWRPYAPPGKDAGCRSWSLSGAPRLVRRVRVEPGWVSCAGCAVWNCARRDAVLGAFVLGGNRTWNGLHQKLGSKRTITIQNAPNA